VSPTPDDPGAADRGVCIAVDLIDLLPDATNGRR
jgi:hypothetical protein